MHSYVCFSKIGKKIIHFIVKQCYQMAVILLSSTNTHLTLDRLAQIKQELTKGLPPHRIKSFNRLQIWAYFIRTRTYVSSLCTSWLLTGPWKNWKSLIPLNYSRAVSGSRGWLTGQTNQQLNNNRLSWKCFYSSFSKRNLETTIL